MRSAVCVLSLSSKNVENEARTKVAEPVYTLTGSDPAIECKISFCLSEMGEMVPYCGFTGISCLVVR